MSRFLALFIFLATSMSVGAANVRVAHLSPDAPAVDVFVGTSADNQTAVLEDVEFGTISGYLPVADGNYFIDVKPSAGGDSVIDVDGIDLAGDLTIAAVNFLTDIEPLVLTDDRVIEPGKAKLRAVHASPDAPNVDIFVDGLGLLPALTDLPFKGATDYLTLDPGMYTFRIRATGSTDDAFVVADLPLMANSNYSAFAVGELLGGTFNVLPAVDAVPEPASGLLLVFVLAAWGSQRRRRA